MSRIPPAEIEAVKERSGGYCEFGGAPVRYGAYHHRKPRASGGKGDLDVAPNLLWGHHACHIWAHAHPDQAYAHGFLVHAGDDPAAAPVTLIRGLCGNAL